MMNPTTTAFGIWSGGRFMHFGDSIDENRYINLIHQAHAKGIRTFMTADVYGNGEADRLLGAGLKDLDRSSYCLTAAIGHDFYQGKRDGSKGYPRFTNSELRPVQDYREYLLTATQKMCERLGVEQLDLLLLHNPDSVGYSHDAVWKGMEALRKEGLTRLLGIAPGPANGFTLDIILSFERFGELIDWAMIILNPLEPWPGKLCLPAAEKFKVDVMTRVVDHGGLFYDDVKPGHRFGEKDHRTFRPAGWVEAGNEKIERMRPIAERYGITMLQLASIWNLSQPAVKSVIPTLIQEINPGAKSIEDKVNELAALPDIRLTPEECAELEEIGNNKGCMALKGGNPEHSSDPLPDRWALNQDLLGIAERWNIRPDQDLVYSH